MEIGSLANGEDEKLVAEASDIEPAFDCLVKRRRGMRVGYDEVLLSRWKRDPEAVATQLLREREEISSS